MPDDELVERLAALEEGERVDLVFATHETLVGWVTDVDVEQDGLTATATRTVEFESISGSEATVVVENDQHGDSSLEYAAVGCPDEDGSLEFPTLERVEESRQRTLTEGGESP